MSRYAQDSAGYYSLFDIPHMGNRKVVQRQQAMLNLWYDAEIIDTLRQEFQRSLVPKDPQVIEGEFRDITDVKRVE